MEWHVQYRSGGVSCVVWHSTPEGAIEAACRLVDEGGDVFGIGMGSPEDSVDRDQVARIYALWARSKRPFGR
jgi:hypothetical protein